MAFEYKLTLEEQDNCKDVNVFDSTGTYNITTNTTGYGSPNVASSAITQLVLKVYKYGSAVPVTITLTVAAGTISAATLTSADGTVTNILADLASTAYPITEAAPLVITGEYLTGVEDSTIDSDAYYIESEITNGTNVYVFDVDQLFSCSACCCVTKTEAAVDAKDCKCDKKKVMNAFYARAFLNSAISAMEQEMVDQAHNNIVEAKLRCSGECTTC